MPLSPVCTQYCLYQREDQSEPSFFNRFCINWKKMILFSNTTLLVIGIAVAFFMKLPLVVLGLGAYGVLYVFLDLYSSREENTELLKKQEKLNQQISRLEKKKVDLEQTASRIQRRINALRSEEKGLSQRRR